MQLRNWLLLSCAALPAIASAKGGIGSYFAMDEPGTVRVGLHAEGRQQYFSNYTFLSFERFRGFYNTANASRLKTPLGELRPQSGLAWGGGMHANTSMGGYYFTYTRSSYEATAVAVLNNGDQRQMKVELKPVNMNFDILIGLGRRVQLGAAIGMEIQNGTIYSGYRYINGFLSYGTDQSINGVYRFRGNSAINLGARMDIHIVRQLRLSLRGEYCGAFAGKQKESGELLPHRDEMYGQASSGGIHNDGEAHYYLPENVRDANNEFVYNIGQGANFAKTFRGWRYSVGLVLDLVTFKANN